MDNHAEGWRMLRRSSGETGSSVTGCTNRTKTKQVKEELNPFQKGEPDPLTLALLRFLHPALEGSEECEAKRGGRRERRAYGREAEREHI